LRAHEFPSRLHSTGLYKPEPYPAILISIKPWGCQSQAATCPGEVIQAKRGHGSQGFLQHGRRAGAPFFEKGGIKFAILDLLKDRPRHGYDIILEMERRSGGLYSPSPGAVYPTLQALEDQGLVTHTVEEGRKTYTLTEAGLVYLEERQERVRRHRERWAGHWGEWQPEEWVSGEPRIQVEVGELLSRLTQTVRNLAGDPSQAEEVRRILEEAVAKAAALVDRRPQSER